ncbi:hypothetical protein E2320_006529 [Naja naja]|nr:hypothetical protein E2320_006529 [Naja naja]
MHDKPPTTANVFHKIFTGLLYKKKGEKGRERDKRKEKGDRKKRKEKEMKRNHSLNLNICTSHLKKKKKEIVLLLHSFVFNKSNLNLQAIYKDVNSKKKKLIY